MFIERLHHPTIEFDGSVGQLEPTLTHFFSTLAEPLKTAIPLLLEAGNDELVLVVASPLSEVVDETIRLHRDMDFTAMVVVDQKNRAFFSAVKASLEQAIAKIDQIQYVTLDDEDEGD